MRRRSTWQAGIGDSVVSALLKRLPHGKDRFTPDARKAKALAVLEKYHYGPLFMPPSLQKPTIFMPGIAGGASWSGAACEPETGILYVPSITLPVAATMAKSPLPHADYVGDLAPVEMMQGVPFGNRPTCASPPSI